MPGLISCYSIGEFLAVGHGEEELIGLHPAFNARSGRVQVVLEVGLDPCPVLCFDVAEVCLEKVREVAAQLVFAPTLYTS